MSKESEALQELMKAIKFFIHEEISKASFDRTLNGRVVSIVDEKTYKVNVKNNVYELPYYGNGTLVVNDIVKVVIPENNMNNIFILGK